MDESVIYYNVFICVCCCSCNDRWQILQWRLEPGQNIIMEKVCLNILCLC